MKIKSIAIAILFMPFTSLLAWNTRERIIEATDRCNASQGDNNCGWLIFSFILVGVGILSGWITNSVIKAKSNDSVSTDENRAEEKDCAQGGCFLSIIVITAAISIFWIAASYSNRPLVLLGLFIGSWAVGIAVAAVDYF